MSFVRTIFLLQDMREIVLVEVIEWGLHMKESKKIVLVYRLESGRYNSLDKGWWLWPYE